jgi:hypothetical protein
MMMKATVHTGPKGGLEFRLWSDDGIAYRVVGKYKAWPHMTEEERIKATALEETRRAAIKAKAELDHTWWRIMRGR